MSELIERLTADWAAAKYREQLAKKTRLLCEDALANAMANKRLEGTKTFKSDTVSVSVTNKLKRTLDYKAYQSIRHLIPEGCDFVEYDPKIDLAKLRHIEASFPAIANACITSKPEKYSIRAEVLL